MNNQIKHFIIAQKLASLRSQIYYYKNSYLPELKETTGSDQVEHLSNAEDKKERFLSDLKDYQQNKHFDSLNLTRSEIANGLRLFAIYEYEKARDFPDNPFIKIRSLKNCVLALQELKKLLPELQPYSNRYLATRTAIKLNN